MDDTVARYWGQRIKNSYSASKWTDQAGEIFGTENIPQMEQALNRLGAVGESAALFVRKAEELLAE